MKRKRRKLSSDRVNYFRLILIFILALIILVIGIPIVIHAWDGQSRFTFVLENIDKGDIALFSIEPQENRGKYIYIKNNLMMDIPYGFKTYQASSIYKLGQLDNKIGGGKLLKASIETTFGIKTDRYLRSSSFKSLPDSEQSYEEFKKANLNFYSGMKFLTTIIKLDETDINILEKIKIYLALKNLKLSEMKILNLENSQTVSQYFLLDKTEVLKFDPEIFDHLYGDDFQNINVRREEFTIEVQNATGVEKMAKGFARVLNSLGSYVILRSTAESESKNGCIIFFKHPKINNSEIVKILKKDYHCKVNKNNDNLTLRSDLLVIIGREFLQ